MLDEVLASDRLTDEEAEYVAAARVANALRGYRSDWAEFTGWCEQHTTTPLTAGPAAVSGYLTYLARHGTKVGTMSRRARTACEPGSSPTPTSAAPPTGPSPTRPATAP